MGANKRGIKRLINNARIFNGARQEILLGSVVNADLLLMVMFIGRAVVFHVPDALALAALPVLTRIALVMAAVRIRGTAGRGVISRRGTSFEDLRVKRFGQRTEAT